MCTDQPSGNKTNFMVVYNDFVHNYMLQRGVLFLSSGVGDAEQLILLCSQIELLLQPRPVAHQVYPLYLEMGTVHIKTLVVFVTSKAGSWTDQVQTHSLRGCVFHVTIKSLQNYFLTVCFLVTFICHHGSCIYFSYTQNKWCRQFTSLITEPFPWQISICKLYLKFFSWLFPACSHITLCCANTTFPYE